MDLPNHDEFEAQHRAEHPSTVDGCLACKLDTFQVSAAVNPNGVAPTVKGGNNWEKGITGTHRPDGSFMPNISAETGAPIRVKQFSEQRHDFEDQVRRRTQPDRAAV